MPPPARRPIFLVEGQRDYPKLFTIDEHPPVREIVIIARHKKPSIQFLITNARKLGDVISLPHLFQTVSATTPFGDFCIYRGVIVSWFQEEIRLYQELILQLSMEGYFDPAYIGPRYDRITKMVALAERGGTQGESETATLQAIKLSRKLLLGENNV